MNRAKFLVLLVMVAIIDAQFINHPPDFESKCSNENVYFNWTYAIPSSVLFVEWKVNGSRIAIESVATSQPFSPVSAYGGRLSKIANAQISLGPLTKADTGTYKAEVSYTNGITGDSNQISLFVYDELNNQTEIVKTPGDGMVTLKPSFYDSSITYTWKLQGKDISTGSSYDAKLDGNYTLCISGGRANCLNPTISSCDSIEVSGLNGLTTSSSTISSDMSTTVSEPLSTINFNMSATVSEAPLTPVTTSSAGLSQEIAIIIAIVISSALAAGALILLVVLVVRQCRRKNKGTQDDLKSYKPRKYKLSEKRNTKRGSTSLDKKKDAQLENCAPKDRTYQRYPQTTDYWNNYRNQHVFNNSMFYGNQHDNYLRPHSRPNNRMLYQSHYPEYSGHNEELFENYRVDNSYRGQQMYQRPYFALYDSHIIDNKQDDKRSSNGKPYEKNWDLLYY